VIVGSLVYPSLKTKYLKILWMAQEAILSRNLGRLKDLVTSTRELHWVLMQPEKPKFLSPN
jgi:hypothetical protein